MKDLDVAFKQAFEALRNTKDYTAVIRLLRKGASARLLETNELGSYNLAMLINDLAGITDREELDMAVEVIRLSIAAGADIIHQKEYAGNGGAPAIQFLCINLGRALTEMTKYQYTCCYNLFPLIAAHSDRDELNIYLSYLSPHPEIKDMQDHLLVQMQELGWKLREEPDTWLFRSLLQRDITILFKLDYHSLNETGIQQLLNGFTSTPTARKVFRTQAHKEMLKTIMERSPLAVFNLIKRNERDMLVPFLKHFKKEIAAQHTLLQVKGVEEKTKQLLRQAGMQV